ncbi:MAG: ABC transporter ATP-binding protein [Chloroflexi bacterium HGW-Chloroflexi-4]|jgi:ABC-2 type transport system ATP-binding protein|nr:MAG: ABC transporter ATP-binding protein [Chloroflexi bacterium HGW-Chloroflexi-4]
MPEIALQTRHLVKKYGALTAVSDLNLEVYEGEVFGFLGPNGAGKTTSINMLCGLLKPNSGEVLIHGTLLDHRSDIQQRVGVCPQSIILWSSLTCIEQLVFLAEMYDIPARVARSRAEQLLEVMHLTEKRNQLAKTLSGGMQRRLNLIMALMHDPEILVLDEPEAGLDPQSRVLVRDFIKSLARKKTVILTTHNMDEADRVADRIAIIDHGQLLALGTPDELKTRVGQGDVLEFIMPEAGMADLYQSLLSPIGADITTNGEELILRSRGIVELLPRILEILQTNGLHPGDLRLRQNSLEDVFITLTGRRLRE